MRQPPFPYKGLATMYEMTDTVTSQFRRRRNHGEVIMNPLFSERVSLNMIPAEYKFQWVDMAPGKPPSYRYNERSTQQWMPDDATTYAFNKRTRDQRTQMLTLTDPVMPYSDDELVLRAAGKLASKDNLTLVTLAELGKTLGSLKDAVRVLSRLREWAHSVPLERLRKVRKLSRIQKVCGADGLSRLDLGLDEGARFALLSITELMMKDAPKLWLEYRYGLLPTYYDVRGYVKSAQTLGRRRERFVASMVGTRTSNPSSYDQVIKVDYLPAVYLTIDRTHVRTRRKVVGFLVTAKPKGLAELHDLGIDRLASTLWELTPLSFVADWFVNVSDVLKAHEGLFTQEVLGSWMTTEDRVVQSWQQRGQGMTGENYRTDYSFDLGCIEQYDRRVRTVSPKIPVLPEVKVNLNIQRVMDLGALALGFGKGLSRLRI